MATVILLLINTGRLSLADDDLVNGSYQFLLRQKNDKTGLVDSFVNTRDLSLKSQASTYDLALAGLGFLKLGDNASARKILSFFDKTWTEAGLCNFYNTSTGSCGLEWTAHLGPNMWVAMLALRYTQETQDERFYPLARKIVFWGMRLKHDAGALAMGVQQDWGADWPNVFGVESNIVAYSVFRKMAFMEKDRAVRDAFELEMQSIRDFLNKVAIVRDERGHLQNIVVGHSIPAGLTRVVAGDVISMMLLVFETKELGDFFGVNEAELVDLATKRFFVHSDGISGFDFTDEEGARSAKRPRMISLEWTMQMACALKIQEQSLSRSWVDEVDKKMIRSEGAIFYAYATKPGFQVFPFAPWWKTPHGEPGLCGSMASTMWRLFYEKGFNPLGM